MLFVELTARCNERCLHCYVDAGPTRSEALASETLRRVIEDAAALGFRALKSSRGLAETPVTARRMQWMPMLAPPRNRGVVAGLALRF